MKFWIAILLSAAVYIYISLETQPSSVLKTNANSPLYHLTNSGSDNLNVDPVIKQRSEISKSDHMRKDAESHLDVEGKLRDNLNRIGMPASDIEKFLQIFESHSRKKSSPLVDQVVEEFRFENSLSKEQSDHLRKIVWDSITDAMATDASSWQACLALRLTSMAASECEANVAEDFKNEVLGKLQGPSFAQVELERIEPIRERYLQIIGEECSTESLRSMNMLSLYTNDCE